MRQLVHKKCEEQGFKCPCIRCSEIKDRPFDKNMVFNKIKFMNQVEELNIL